ncbi:MAG: hypothetical protein RSD67_07340 [Oscillospiraceae bacterium]
MIVESLSASAIILIMSYIYLRMGKPNLSLSILPLTFVPAVYILSIPIAGVINSAFTVSEPLSRAFMVLVAAVTACCVFGFLSNKIRKKSFKSFYAILCTGFTIIFAWVLILDLIKPLLIH